METNYKGHSNKSGVYQIRNLKNGKVYIGSAKNFKKRQYQHLAQLKSGRHRNKHLKAAFNKYGSDNFIFEVLEVVVGDALARTTVEQSYFDKFLNTDKWDQCYNLSKIAVQKDRSCYSLTPEKTKQKQSEITKKLWEAPEFREKISEASKKMWEAPEFREKMSETFNNPEYIEKRSEITKKLWENPDFRQRLSGPKPIELRKRWSEAKTGKKGAPNQNAVKAMNKARMIVWQVCLKGPNNQIVYEIDNLPNFCKENKLQYSLMLKLIKGERKIHKGWVRVS